MRSVYLFLLIIAGLVATTAGASAQRFSDNPPGWAFQRRGIIEMNGGNPLRYGHRYSGWRGAYARGHVRHSRSRYHR